MRKAKKHRYCRWYRMLKRGTVRKWRDLALTALELYHMLGSLEKMGNLVVHPKVLNITSRNCHTRIKTQSISLSCVWERYLRSAGGSSHSRCQGFANPARRARMGAAGVTCLSNSSYTKCRAETARMRCKPRDVQGSEARLTFILLVSQNSMAIFYTSHVIYRSILGLIGEYPVCYTKSGCQPPFIFPIFNNSSPTCLVNGSLFAYLFTCDL